MNQQGAGSPVGEEPAGPAATTLLLGGAGEAPHLLLSAAARQSLSRPPLFATPWAQLARPPRPSPSPRARSNSWPLSR